MPNTEDESFRSASIFLITSETFDISDTSVAKLATLLSETEDCTESLTSLAFTEEFPGFMSSSAGTTKTLTSSSSSSTTMPLLIVSFSFL